MKWQDNFKIACETAAATQKRELQIALLAAKPGSVSTSNEKVLKGAGVASESTRKATSECTWISKIPQKCAKLNFGGR